MTLKECFSFAHLESVVSFVNDFTHAIMPLDVTFQDKLDEVGKIACGLLNSRKFFF